MIQIQEQRKELGSLTTDMLTHLEFVAQDRIGGFNDYQDSQVVLFLLQRVRTLLDQVEAEVKGVVYDQED